MNKILNDNIIIFIYGLRLYRLLQNGILSLNKVLDFKNALFRHLEGLTKWTHDVIFISL